MLPLMWCGLAFVVAAIFAPFAYFLLFVVRDPVLILVLLILLGGISATGFFAFDLDGLTDFFRMHDRASERRRRRNAQKRQSD
jgi:hypothetical protein